MWGVQMSGKKTVLDKLAKATLRITLKTLAFLKETITDLENLAKEINSEMVREDAEKEKRK